MWYITNCSSLGSASNIGSTSSASLPEIKKEGTMYQMYKETVTTN